MPRVIRTRVEFEGQSSELLAYADKDLRRWPRGRPLASVGTSQPRVDGRERVTGRARYTCDISFAGMLHAVILRSPHARAQVRSVDASAALALEGVHDVLHRFNAPPLTLGREAGLFRDEVRFSGDEVAAILAEDESTAREAASRIRVDYRVLPHAVDVEDALAPNAPALAPEGNVRENARSDRGEPDRAFAEADVVVGADYRTASQLHSCMETHGAVAVWDGSTLTVHEGTAHIFGVRSGLAATFGLPLSQVRVLGDFMGGGFGSKNRAAKYSVIASLFAMRSGRPVRCVLTREEENLATGARSQTFQRVRLAARGGRITAIEHHVWSSSGQSPNVAAATGPANVIYDVPNLRTRSSAVLTNVGSWAAFRGPGYVEGTFALESAIDELAERTGIDPLELRRRHLATRDPQTGMPFTLKALAECYDIGAAEIGWERRRTGGLPGSTPTRRRGIGMATQAWGGAGSAPAYAMVHLNADGTAVVRAGTQDVGTGTKTILAQVAAEELGLPLGRIKVEIGDTNMPFAPLSAGSQTAASVGPAVRAAAADAAAQLRVMLAGILELPPSGLRIEAGDVLTARGATPLGEVLAKLPNYTVIGRGARQPNPAGFVTRTWGAHFVELEVDVATGEIFIERLVAVHDVGRILNPLTALSVMEGGIVQGLGFALMEERVVDRLTGRVASGDLESYKVPTVRDVPPIVVRLIDRPDNRANNLGVKGLGEPPVIPVAAAVANAVANATGVRIRTTPLSPARVLGAITTR